MKNVLVSLFCILSCICNAEDSLASAQETHADWIITTEVKAKILIDTQLSAEAHLVSVTTTNGVVTLNGTVPTAADIDRLVAIAKSVDGVKEVNVQITVSK